MRGDSLQRKSSPISIRCCVVGLAILSMLIRIRLSGVDSFVRRRLRAMLRKQEKATRLGSLSRGSSAAGPMPSSRKPGCSPYGSLEARRANPDEETTDWRAVCGRTARTVRRAGRAKSLPDPYLNKKSSVGECFKRSLAHNDVDPLHAVVAVTAEVPFLIDRLHISIGVDCADEEYAFTRRGSPQECPCPPAIR